MTGATLALLAAATAARTLSPEDLLATHRLDDVQVSPDGKRAAFTVRQKSLAENRDTRDVWLIDLPAGPARPFTRDGHSDHARFSPDGKALLLVSERGGAEPQLYLYDLLAGGDGRKLTSLHSGASEAIFAPDGKRIAFVSEVNPACSGNTAEVEACTRRRAEERAKSKLKAHLVDKLMYRHWNEWRDQKRQHIFVIELGPGEPQPRDLTPGDADWPTWSMGGGSNDFAFSADGRTLYVAHKRPEGEAWHTNGDLYAVPVAGGAPRPLTADNPGDDSQPTVSPDGKWLAYLSQPRDGYESDAWRLRFIELASGRIVPSSDEAVDVSSLRWKPDSSGLVASKERAGRRYLTTISLDGKVTPFAEAAGGADFALLPDGSALMVASTLQRQPELYRLAPGASALEKLTSFNAELAAALDLGPAAEDVWIEAKDGAKVHSLVLRPPGLRDGQRAPLVVLVHGGPQGAWHDDWGMRWSAAAYAARGYAVLMPNPRGSSGYGRKFEEQISQDWGGLAYDDVMRSVDAAERLPFVQAGNACAAGASYGGYLINWIAGHTDRFKCLVSHAGVFDLVAEYGSTEELWFPEWEIGGPYWEHPDEYRRWSPSSYVKQFKTPTLVTMGELDFRVPTEQPFGMFTALQRRGVESRLLDFPDEGHWINKPKNSLLWYRTVLDWIDAHLKHRAEPAKADAN